MENITCFRNCKCTLKKFPQTFQYYDEPEIVNRKCAGVCVISKNGVLINQSHNLFWGIPKGLVENEETLKECALRELFEETGIILNNNIFSKYIFSFRYKNLNRKVTIFFTIIKNNEEFDDCTLSKDSTGYGFIQPICLLELLYSRKIKVNYFTRIIINKLFFSQ